MGQIIHNISNPNDGLGEALRSAFDDQNTMNSELYNGKVDKVTGKGLTDVNFSSADKAKLDSIDLAAQVNVQSDWLQEDDTKDDYIKNRPDYLNAIGTFHYADLATQTTPINVTANTETLLTNDALGEYTSITNAPYGVPTVYNATNNEFDFSALAVGDLVHIRPDLLIDLVGTNTSYEIYMKFAIGTASEWVLNLSTSERKSADEFKKNAYLGFDIANEDTRTAPAKMFIKTDAAATVKVNGYYLEVLRKNINIVDFTDSNAVHKTGNETIQGVKTFEDKIVGKAGELHGIVIASENEELAGIGSNDDFKPFFFLKKPQSIAKGIIKNELLTGVRTYEMPDASGTLALTEIIVNKISGTKTLSNADNGKVFILTANCTVTIPSGLTSGFNATFRTLTGATYSQSLGGGVTLLGNVGSTMGGKSSFTMVNTDVANEYLITGSL